MDDHPLLAQITRLIVLVFLISSMTGIGLGLMFREVVAPLANGRLLAVAFFVNYLLAPATAIAVARLFRLEEPFAIGLLLLGLGGGAPFMPKLAALAKAEPSHAVALMVVLMAATPVVLPLALPVLVPGVEVEPLPIAGYLVLLMLLPLAAGMVLRARRPDFAVRWQPRLERVSTTAMVLMLVMILLIYFEGVRQIFGTGAIAAAIVFTLGVSGPAWLLGGRLPADRALLGLASGLRNIPAALLVAVQNFEDPKVTVMVVVSTLVATVILAPLAARRGQSASNRNHPTS